MDTPENLTSARKNLKRAFDDAVRLTTELAQLRDELNAISLYLFNLDQCIKGKIEETD